MFNAWFPQNMTTLRKLLWFRTAWEKSGSPPTPSDPLNTFVGSIVRFLSQRAKPIKSIAANFTLVQSGTGDPSPDNIRPISGHTGCDIFDKAEYDPQATPTATVTFPSTVYGGTMTINEDGSGSVVATMGMKSISDLNFTAPYSIGTPGENVFRSAVVNEMQAACDPICSAYKTKAWGETITYLGDYQIQTGYSAATQQQIFINSKDYNKNTLSDWKSAFGSQTVVYPLATPVTIPLTASQIQTLVGNNVVWVTDADGDITVKAYGTPVGTLPIVGTGQAGYMII